MSEKLLRFFLSELSVIRIVCQSPLCGAVTEIPIDRLGSAFSQAACPVCRSPFGKQTGDPSPFVPLAEAIARLRSLNDQVEVEFVIPEKT